MSCTAKGRGIDKAISLTEAERYTRLYWRQVDQTIEKVGLFSRIRHPLYASLEETIMSASAVNNMQAQAYIITQVLFGMQERRIMVNRNFGCGFGGTLFDVVKRSLMGLARGIKEKQYKVSEKWLKEYIFDPFLSVKENSNELLGENLGDWPQLVQDFKMEMASEQPVAKSLKANLKKRPPASSARVAKKQKKGK